MTKQKKLSIDKNDRLAWWRKARFGMFIHWGLYAVPAGTWKGQRIGGIGEWIMRSAKIPIPEYEKLARRFNPVKFNANEVAKLAKEAGMKYLVITAKHHDGFGMFRSPCCSYNIVDATPFRRDPMKELASACKKHGIKLCFYYSQNQDWHAPGGAGHWECGQDWHSAGFGKKAFEEYLRNKVKPQLKELLTQYGPIGLIWFDTPGQMIRRQSLDLKRFVHRLQPKCLVSGRVGNALGDYGSMGDNQIPASLVKGDWETPATMNRTWGYKTYDHDWKSVGTLLYLLVDLASKGVNYLLNIGPTAKGTVPQPSIVRLRAIGKWMKVNGEAIYGTQPNPYPYEFGWGRITQKPGKLYLLFYHWPKRRSFKLFGLQNKVKKAYLLTKPKKKIPLAQTYEKKLGHHELELKLPAQKSDKYVSVVVIDIQGKAKVDAKPYQQPDGTIALGPHQAKIQAPAKAKRPDVIRTGEIRNWTDPRCYLTWRFRVVQPGRFQVKVLTSAVRKWEGGHKIGLSLAGKKLQCVIKDGGRSTSPRALHNAEFVTKVGELSIAEPGIHELKLEAVSIRKDVPGGLVVSEVQLVPKK